MNSKYKVTETEGQGEPDPEFLQERVLQKDRCIQFAPVDESLPAEEPEKEMSSEEEEEFECEFAVRPKKKSGGGLCSWQMRWLT